MQPVASASSSTYPSAKNPSAEGGALDSFGTERLNTLGRTARSEEVRTSSVFLLITSFSCLLAFVVAVVASAAAGVLAAPAVAVVGIPAVAAVVAGTPGAVVAAVADTPAAAVVVAAVAAAGARGLGGLPLGLFTGSITSTLPWDIQQATDGDGLSAAANVDHCA